MSDSANYRCILKHLGSRQENIAFKANSKSGVDKNLHQNPLFGVDFGETHTTC